MTPLLFGDSKRPLFGVMHEPPSGEGSVGVLLCPPIGQEHVRTHWAFRQLAAGLARAGYYVLRFDWSGVGDSSGDIETATIPRWLEDAEVASQELRDATGVSKVIVVGMRLGAALAALSAKQIRPAAVVLWEPVWSGTKYLVELETLDQALVGDPKRFWYRWPPGFRKVFGARFPSVAQERKRVGGDVLGMRLTAQLRAGIEAIEARSFEGLGGTRVVVVESGTSATELVKALSSAGASPEVRSTRLDARFRDPAQIEELLLPGDAVRAIVDAVQG